MIGNKGLRRATYRAAALCSVAVLAGCGGGGGDGDGGTTATLGDVFRTSLGLAGTELSQMQTALGASFIGRLADFSPTRLAAVRAERPFTANVLNVPDFGTIRPLQASRLDWARSIDLDNDGRPDLTGQNVVLGMIDSPVLASHEQFGPGKFLTFGTSTPETTARGPDGHGTFVASVMAGRGVPGAPVIGYAPDAQIYAGQISYQAALNYTALAGIMDGAAAAGAVAVNNSWTLSQGGAPATVANASVASMGTGFSTYVNALRRYTQDGVVVFAQFNTDEASSSIMAGLPAEVPELEQGWLAVINVLASYDPATDRITSVERMSGACLEAARWCLGATGYLWGAGPTGNANYTVGAGTSYAAPQVTGALGLLADAFPGLTPAQLRNRLLATADNSFFTPTHELEFVPGVTHGYNEEFGHGFLNVRDALMPIGQSVTSTAAGTVLPMEEVSLSGGMLAGDALAAGLADVRVGFRDQMAGTFAAPMSAFVAQTAPVPVGSVAMQAWSLAAGNRALAAEDGASANGLTRVGLPEGDAPWRLAALTDGTGDAGGLSVSRLWETSGGAVTAEIAAMQGRDGLFGMDLGGGGARAVSASLGWRQALGGATEFAAEAEMGRIGMDGGGLVTAVDGLAYARAGVELAQRSVLRRGDRLSLSVETPLGAVAGQVGMTVASAIPAEGAVAAAASFESLSASMVPEARQVDFGVEYAAPLAGGSEVVMGYEFRENAGHVAGRTDQVAVLGWRVAF